MMLRKQFDARKPFSSAGFVSAEGGNRTHTPLAEPRILRAQIESASH
jgi:hypothetical protein